MPWTAESMRHCIAEGIYTKELEISRVAQVAQIRWLF